MRNRHGADDQVGHDTEASIVAALQESDTAVEAIHDADLDAKRGIRSKHWTITIAGVLLAVIGLVVVRSRR